MGNPYSWDLRKRIVGYVEEGHSARAAAGVFGVSPSTAVRLAASHRDHGSVAPKPQGRAPGTAGKLAAHTGFLLERVTSEPDLTLQELADALKEVRRRSEEHTSELQSLMRISYAVFCLKK